MSVSVLSVSNAGSPFQSGSGRKNDSHLAHMAGPPGTLKRPWEQEHSPPSSSHSMFHRQTPHQPHYQHQQQYQLDSRHHTDETRQAAFDTAPSRHGRHIPGQQSYTDSSYAPTHIGPVPARELSHKRSRIESELSDSTQFGAGIPSHNRASPDPSHMSSQLPGVGLSQSSRSQPERQSTSPGTSSPQSGYYRIHGQLPVLPSPGSVTSLIGAANSSQRPFTSMNSSLLSPVTSSAGHLQSLQHELSAKTSAYSSLASEHERLLAAYARLQTRMTTLDRKSKTADGELTLLQEEQISLQQRADGLEKELEELRASRKSEMEQRNQESEQWRRIIDLSGMVQKRHTDESDKWKAEKGALARQIETLQDELRKVKLGSAGIADGDYETAGAILGKDSYLSTSLLEQDRKESENSLMLRKEEASLRRQNEEAAKQLDEYRSRIRALKDLLTEADSLVDIDRAEPKPS